MRYYEVIPNYTEEPTQIVPGKIRSANGTTVDLKLFKSCRVVPSPPAEYTVDCLTGTVPTHFAFSDFNIPIVTERFVKSAGELCEDCAQFLPIHLSCRGRTLPRFVLNTLVEFDCIDESRSEFLRTDDGEIERHPWGDYFMVCRVAIHAVPRPCHLFKLAKWDSLVISEALMNRLLSRGITGFQCVDIN